MSFILEALKKSQQERALGRVPRLDTGLLIDEPPAARQSPWIWLSVGLACVAVGIALYAVMRAPGQQPLAVRPAVPAPPSGAGVGPRVPAAELGADLGADLARSKRDDGLADMELRYAPTLPGAEAPPPRTALEGPSRAAAPPPAPMPSDRAAATTGAPSVPPDLVEDIVSFKERVLREQPDTAEPAAPSANDGTSRGDGPPPRLPADVLARLPPFLVTAHVYDADPAQRFVVINSLRYGEGERTREGLEVREIRPDGVLLRFAGHSFFQRR